MYSILKSNLIDTIFQVRYQEEYSTLYTKSLEEHQGIILRPLLYSIFRADLPVTEQTLTATYADDTAILASHIDPITGTQHLQLHLDQLEKWLTRWRIRAKESKSTHITFTLRRVGCPAVYLNGKLIPKETSVKYLGIYLDRRLTWKPHIHNKRKQLGLMLNRM